MNRPPLLAHATAVVLGLLAAFAPANLPLDSPSFATSLLISAVIFGTAGLLVGVVWPGGAWRWGLWIIGPGLVLVTIGLMFSGEVGRFLRDDLPFLVSGLLAAASGGWIGSRLRAPSTRARSVGE